MGSTEIVNKTSRAMDMRIGNFRHFVKLATVAKNHSYEVNVDYSDTYAEYSLGPDDSSSKPVIVSSDECVDNKKIIVREIDGRFQVEMQPRVLVRPPSSTTRTTNKQDCEPLKKKKKKKKKKRPCTLWRDRTVGNNEAAIREIEWHKFSSKLVKREYMGIQEIGKQSDDSL